MDAFWIYLFFTAFPLYMTNATAMLFGGKTPIDGNKTMKDGQPILGKGKTWKGTIMGTLIGLVSGYWEGTIDQGLQRGVDTLMAFPGIVLALAVPRQPARSAGQVSVRGERWCGRTHNSQSRLSA